MYYDEDEGQQRALDRVRIIPAQPGYRVWANTSSDGHDQTVYLVGRLTF